MIKVNPDSDPQFNEGIIWFDYFVVSDPGQNGGGQGNGSTGGNIDGQGGGNTGGNTGGEGGGNTGSGSVGGQQGVTPKSKLSNGGIAGCIIGGLILLICIVLCGTLWFRRKRRRKEAEVQQLYREPRHQGHDKEMREDSEQLLCKSLFANRACISRETDRHWLQGAQAYAQTQQPTELGIQQSIFHAPAINPVTVPLLHSLQFEEQSEIISTRPPINLQTPEPPPVLSFPLSVGPRSSMEHQENMIVPSSAINNGINDWSHNAGTQQIRDTLQHLTWTDRSVALPPGSALVDKYAWKSSAVTVITADEERQGSHESSGKDEGMSTRQVSNSEVVARDQGMVAVRHVDSGIRLGVEEVRRLVELPPIYSLNAMYDKRSLESYSKFVPALSCA